MPTNLSTTRRRRTSCGPVPCAVLSAVLPLCWIAPAFAEEPPTLAFPTAPEGPPSAASSTSEALPAPASSSPPSYPAPTSPPPNPGAPAPVNATHAGYLPYAPAAVAPLAVVPPPAPRVFSLTFSPIHLLFPVFEVTGEVRLSSAFSVAGILGAGSLPIESDALQESVSALEAGAQLVLYPMQDFEGLLLGAELLWVRLDLKNASVENSTVSGFSEGIGVGPMVGYKLMTDAGFTFSAQVGGEYFSARAEATDTVTTAKGQDSGWIPLFNLNLGWSF